MMEMSSNIIVSKLEVRITTIEDAYEAMLSFAAQGKQDEFGSRALDIREVLGRLEEALHGLAGVATEALCGFAAEDRGVYIETLARDTKTVVGIVRLVLACRSISSQLIDNLNASIHLRSVLTDLFVIDELLKAA